MVLSSGSMVYSSRLAGLGVGAGVGSGVGSAVGFGVIAGSAAVETDGSEGVESTAETAEVPAATQAKDEVKSEATVVQVSPDEPLDLNSDDEPTLF